MRFARLPLTAAVFVCLIAGVGQAKAFDDVTGYAAAGMSRLLAENSAINSATITLGARLNSYFGVEATGDFGVQSDWLSTTYCPPGAYCAQLVMAEKVKLKTAEAVYAVGFLPLSTDVDLIVRLGYGAAQYSGFSQNSVNLGCGVQYFFSGANGIRADYTRQFYTNEAHLGDPAWGNGQHVFSLAYVRSF